MSTYTNKQLEILLEILRWAKVEIPSLHKSLEKRGRKMHLNEVRRTVNKFEEDELIDIEKISIGVRTFYKILRKNDYKTFKRISSHLLNSRYKLEFIQSEYVQSIIDVNFVDHFAVDWGREYVKFSSEPDPQTTYGKPLEAFQPEELREMFYFHLLGLEKNGLLEILSVSPSCLYNFLFPEEVASLLRMGVPLSTFFLVPFALDASTYGIPAGKGIETKIEVEYGDVKTVKGVVKVIPSVKAKSQFEIINMKGVDKGADNP